MLLWCIQWPLCLLWLSEPSSEPLFPMTWWQRMWSPGFMTVIISFSACFQLLFFLTVPHIIEIAAIPGMAAPAIKPKQKSCHWNIVSADCGLQLMKLMETAVVWLDAVSHLRPGWTEAGRWDKGKIWLVSFSGAQYEPAVNREEMRSVHTSHFFGTVHTHTSPIMMMRFFSSFHHLHIFKYFLKGRLSSRKASCFKSWWSSSPESFCFGRSGGVFPLLIAGDFLSSPGNILLSELWLSGKTSLQWLLDVFFPLDFYIWSMQTVSNLKLHIKYFDSILRHCTWCSI